MISAATVVVPGPMRSIYFVTLDEKKFEQNTTFSTPLGGKCLKLANLKRGTMIRLYLFIYFLLRSLSFRSRY